MQIDFKGRNVPVTDELRRHVERRLEKVGKQVSPLAELELELYEEPTRRASDRQVAEATVHVKAGTLRARECSHDMAHSVNLVLDEISRQVERYNEKRRHRREARASAAERGAAVTSAEEPAEEPAEGLPPAMEPPPGLSTAG